MNTDNFLLLLLCSYLFYRVSQKQVTRFVGSGSGGDRGGQGGGCPPKRLKSSFSENVSEIFIAWK